MAELSDRNLRAIEELGALRCRRAEELEHSGIPGDLAETIAWVDQTSPVHLVGTVSVAPATVAHNCPKTGQVRTILVRLRVLFEYDYARVFWVGRCEKCGVILCATADGYDKEGGPIVGV
jgi:hypothetical protein